MKTKNAEQIYTGDVFRLRDVEYVAVGVNVDERHVGMSIFCAKASDYDNRKFVTTYGIFLPRQMKLEVTGKREHSICRIDTNEDEETKVFGER